MKSKKTKNNKILEEGLALINKKKIIVVSILLSIGILLSLLSFQSSVSFSEFQLIHETGYSQKVAFPLNIKSPKNEGMYQLKGTLHKKIFSPSSYKITADDALLELHINGKTVSLEDIPLRLRSDYRNGFKIDLSEHLMSGDNQLHFVFMDQGGMMGIQMTPSTQDTRFFFLVFAWVVFGIILLVFFRKKMNLSIPYFTLFVLAILIRVVYLSATDFNSRGHDTFEHIEFTKHFVENWALPDIEQATDGAFFHPPLYYFSTAIVYTVVSWLTNSNTSLIYFSLQLFSLLASIGFVFFGMKTILLVFQSRASKKDSLFEGFLTWLSCLLFVFWPSSIIHSTRIGNDPLLYFLFAAGLYFLTRWFIKGGSKSFVLASVFTALAIVTKMNGAILIGVIVSLLFIKVITGNARVSKRNIKIGTLSFLLVMSALAFTMYPSLRLSASGKRDHLYVDNIENVSAGLRVGNNLENFIWLDIKTFVTKPFTSPWEDEFGRQYFLNYQGKTALFGEWRYPSTILHNMAIAISVIALYMLAVALLGIWRLRPKDLYNGLPLILSGVFLWASVCYMRYTFPVNIDFRYILPILIPFCVAFNYGLLELASKKSKRHLAIGVLLTITFIACSIIFMFHVG